MYLCGRMRKDNSYKKKEKYVQMNVQDDAPLLEWLLENVKQSKSKTKATLQNRGIKVNNRTVTQFDFALHKGDKVSVSTSKKNDQFQSKYVKLVYEDRYLVVVEKSHGILSMGVGQSSLNVKTILDDYFKRSRQKCTAHVVHRLDRETSGLLIYAKDMETRQQLEHEWHHSVYDRRYIAILSGRIEEEGGTVANWLKENKLYVTYSSPVDNGGKYAVTHFHVLRTTDTHSLVEFKLETGRKNQIRVHAADINHPVCGDSKYGNGDDPLKRLCLHAYILCFYHPVTHQPMEFSTQIPTGFKRIFGKD
ncbi:RNA pseudouridylate synthase BT0642 [Prevotella intermedia]|uniref:RNA pseudouridylate synthase BT0642 n=2 Tax=Prevotella intermedia TaxID=28131 RepID=A0AAD1BJD2_PREIN|nr:pseudouridine synthase, RluA family [Prevotella intermedia 17]BAR95786.1 RNA pseudouridylate synthase BT0642 [Prevotella intermedia]